MKQTKGEEQMKKAKKQPAKKKERPFNRDDYSQVDLTSVDELIKRDVAEWTSIDGLRKQKHQLEADVAALAAQKKKAGEWEKINRRIIKAWDRAAGAIPSALEGSGTVGIEKPLTLADLPPGYVVQENGDGWFRFVHGVLTPGTKGTPVKTLHWAVAGAIQHQKENNWRTL